jgi:hypothetical protein
MSPIFDEAEQMCRKAATSYAEHLQHQHCFPLVTSVEQAFEDLWTEHLTYKPAVDAAVLSWTRDDGREHELAPGALRQIFLRTTGALSMLAQHRDGTAHIGGEAFEDTSDPFRVIETLVYSFWQGDAWPTDWLRHCAEVQIMPRQGLN